MAPHGVERLATLVLLVAVILPSRVLCDQNAQAEGKVFRTINARALASQLERAAVDSWPTERFWKPLQEASTELELHLDMLMDMKTKLDEQVSVDRKAKARIEERLQETMAKRDSMDAQIERLKAGRLGTMQSLDTTMEEYPKHRFYSKKNQDNMLLQTSSLGSAVPLEAGGVPKREDGMSLLQAGNAPALRKAHDPKAFEPVSEVAGEVEAHMDHLHDMQQKIAVQRAADEQRLERIKAENRENEANEKALFEQLKVYMEGTAKTKKSYLNTMVDTFKAPEDTAPADTATK